MVIDKAGGSKIYYVVNCIFYDIMELGVGGGRDVAVLIRIKNISHYFISLLGLGFQKLVLYSLDI